MKIGIITFHRANNYGAVLQCYALNRILKSFGHEVKVVDYRQPYMEQQYRPFSMRYFRHLLMTCPQALPKYIAEYSERKALHPLFSNFRDRHFRMTASSRDYIPQGIDTYIIGSDQLWSNYCTGGLVPIYYGEFIRDPKSRIFGYAISSNVDTINSIPKEQLTEYMRNFKNMSFRERKISDMVTSKTGVGSRVDIDPTLLLDSSQWSDIVDKKWSERKYVLLYQLRTKRGRGTKLREKAMELAQNMGCELIDLSQGEYSIESYVSLFKYAECVVTSSFHGVAFSLIFERPLYPVMLGDGQDGRYVNLLRELGADNLLVDMEFDPVPSEIDYAPINKKLSELKERSIQYLKRI